MASALPTNIEKLINAEAIEGETIEFKEGFNPEVVVHSICAFANDLNSWGGGHIFLGINENAGKPIFPPTGLVENQVDAHQKKLRELINKLDPPCLIVIKPYMFEGKRILAIWVPASDSRPHTAPRTLGNHSERKYYIRQGSNTVIANKMEEERLLEIASKIKFDNRVHLEATLSDLDVNLIRNYLLEIRSELYEEAQTMSLEDLCISMLLSKGPKGDSRPLNAAVLLFSNDPQKYFPGACIDVVFFKEDGESELEPKTFSGPLPKQINDSLNFINVNVLKERVKKNDDQAKAEVIKNYPFRAVKEALLNAVLHRDYQVDNKIEIIVFPSYIQIISYTGPMPPVNEKTIQQERIDVRNYRNPRIGYFLRELRLVEERGIGILNIKKAMRANGSLPPEFDFGDNNTHFTVLLKIHPDWSDEIPQTVKISPRLLTNNEQIILESCVKASDIAKIKQEVRGKVSAKDAEKIVAKLIQENLLDRTIFKSFGGLIRTAIYQTTTEGMGALKHSF